MLESCYGLSGHMPGDHCSAIALTVAVHMPCKQARRIAQRLPKTAAQAMRPREMLACAVTVYQYPARISLSIAQRQCCGTSCSRMSSTLSSASCTTKRGEGQ